MSYLKIRNLEKRYGNKVNAVAGVDLTLEKKKQYVILGASGSGKSTLLYLLGGLEKADQGEILLDGQDLVDYNDEELATYRNKQVGFVFQFHFLLPSMNCYENILLPSKISGKIQKDIKSKIEALASELGVSHCLEKFPFELSGGEQQRINIIRALSLEPELLLCDEPTGNLDSENSQKVVTLLKKLANQYGSTLIIVTHDLSIAEQFNERIVMKDGKIHKIEHGAMPTKNATATPVTKPTNEPETSSTIKQESDTANSEVDSTNSKNSADSLSESKPKGYTGINPEESKSTEELLEQTKELLNETEKLLGDD